MHICIDIHPGCIRGASTLRVTDLGVPTKEVFSVLARASSNFFRDSGGSSPTNSLSCAGVAS